ncbi:TetR/AcrR family transcriptional regulator [Acanthopleuribacter pedis]|uniref:TetR/AcrR family transcriptional regulator n=1 Tax=Acanthopleuribacter pedis TaxID=442870 RepID=A0A8J7Q9H0_9BACT|nr:TetR/AcrR family transcriptional regulator [Acanthopleuribacter pedis]MBO1321106.1 TetR/AcrR family transcriptional regulator [Acanthopleuribacter pedis]
MVHSRIERGRCPLANTADRIVQAAVTCLAHNPKATLTELAESAGVSRMTLHRHFKTRELLLEAVQHHLVTKTLAIVAEAAAGDADPRDQLRHIIEACVRRQNGFHLLMQGAGSHEDHDRDTCPFAEMNRRILTLIETLQARGDIRPDLPVDWVFHSFDGVIYVAWECLQRGTVAPRDVPRLAWETFSGGVFTHTPD